MYSNQRHPSHLSSTRAIFQESYEDGEHLDLIDVLRRGRTGVVNQTLQRRSSKKDHL